MRQADRQQKEDRFIVCFALFFLEERRPKKLNDDYDKTIS